MELDGKVFKMYFDDQLSLDMLAKEKYRQILGEFFGSLGLSFVASLKKRQTGDVDALSSALNGKLEIKE